MIKLLMLVYKLKGDLVCKMLLMQNTLQTWWLVASFPGHRRNGLGTRLGGCWGDFTSVLDFTLQV